MKSSLQLAQETITTAKPFSMKIPLALTTIGATIALGGCSLSTAPARAMPAERIASYLNGNANPKLQIGAGPNNLAGWLNTDIEPTEAQAYLDAAKPFPLPDNSVKYIYSEHVIEHLGYEEALEMLAECRRVLAQGGKVRIATPNLLKFIKLFDEVPSADMSRYIDRKHEWHRWPKTADPTAFILNKMLTTWGHRFLFTPKMLRASLEAAGFTGIQEFPVGESDDPVFTGIEVRARQKYSDANAYETMVFQAVRK